ncbi:MAG: flagellar export chaperone FliS [Proteobacteria bacterium]|nr:MAG: flagellar export chaperone FliS [Pseudomonadota bacterium]
MIRKFQAYKKMHITTAAPGDLVVMLYDGLVRFTRTAQRALNAQLYTDAGQAIDKALAIIGHLQESLDDSASPELTRTLDTTYAAWSTNLVRANIRKDTEALGKLAEQMAGLRDAWREVNKQAQAQLAEGA